MVLYREVMRKSDPIVRIWIRLVDFCEDIFGLYSRHMKNKIRFLSHLRIAAVPHVGIPIGAKDAFDPIESRDVGDCIWPEHTFGPVGKRDVGDCMHQKHM